MLGNKQHTFTKAVICVNSIVVYKYYNSCIVGCVDNNWNVLFQKKRAAPNDYFKGQTTRTKTKCVTEMTQPEDINDNEITPKKGLKSEKIQPNQAGLLLEVSIAPPRRKRSVTVFQNI